ncbi:MAG: VCBS repeat-containing protein [Burkholderiales bacterium]
MNALAVAPVFGPQQLYPVDTVPSAVAVGDIDGDGRADVVLTTLTDRKLLVFMQRPDGTLAPPVAIDGGNGRSVAVGDVNGDDRADIVTTYNDGVGVRLNLGGGMFAPVAKYGDSSTELVIIADVTGDGRNDIVAMPFLGPSINVFAQRADGTMAPPIAYAAPHGGFGDMKAGDLNGDGRMDVVVSGSQGIVGENLVFLLQRADGTLGPPRIVPFDFGPWAVAGLGLLDVDGDGQIDILGTGGGYYPDGGLIVVPNAGGTWSSFYRLPTYNIPEPVAIADFNFDGLPDVLVGHVGWQRVGVHARLPGGGLDTEVLMQVPGVASVSPQAIAAGDVNGDGKTDIVVAYYAGLVVLPNVTPRAVSGPVIPVPSLALPAVLWLIALMALVALRVRKH